MIHGQFPQTRLRRNRKNSWTRALARETCFHSDQLIWPIFVREEAVDAKITSMPDVKRFSLDELQKAIPEAVALGIKAVMLFPVIANEKRTDDALACLDLEGILPRAIKTIRSCAPDMNIITDPALDPYTSHGQDGLIRNGVVDNDATLELLAKFALVQADAGADVIAPSEMMDGRIQVLRSALDEAGHTHVSLFSYAAKYASCFYGPFRNAVASDACLGGADKMTYQMDPANRLEALREVAFDLEEGADMIIVKPGLGYLDVLSHIKDRFQVPVLSFQVSAEYAMIKAAAKEGYVNYENTLMETMTCFARAGTSAVITYAALDVARILAGKDLPWQSSSTGQHNDFKDPKIHVA